MREGDESSIDLLPFVRSRGSRQEKEKRKDVEKKPSFSVNKLSSTLVVFLVQTPFPSIHPLLLLLLLHLL